MWGGVFEGTNDNPATGPYTAIHPVLVSPADGWNVVNVSLGSFRYLRFRSPGGSYGNVSEIEFYRAGVKVTGIPFGTAGSYGNLGNTFTKALDGNTSTFFDAATGESTYIGIDTGDR